MPAEAGCYVLDMSVDIYQIDENLYAPKRGRSIDKAVRPFRRYGLNFRPFFRGETFKYQ
jgi:hypothetical protein